MFHVSVEVTLAKVTYKKKYEIQKKRRGGIYGRSFEHGTVERAIVHISLRKIKRTLKKQVLLVIFIVS